MESENKYLLHIGGGVWIHTLSVKNDKKLPMVENNKQNKNLGVDGSKKKRRCSECTFPESNCKCKK